ncbi:MAG TPA: glycosyltransferase family 39 protein [Candidatus Nitrosotalea sp.]|nr:glycosyltransferase family 39 protein [Candidatus Nitrosotalea sp.]
MQTHLGGPTRTNFAYLIAAGALLLELGVAGRYGFHRDELYFIACAKHLALGYVDQPVFTPLIAGAGNALFHGSLVGFRLIPAISFAALVIVTARLARLLGADRLGQAMAALCAALCGEYIAAAHLVSPTPFDQLAWVVIAWLTVRMLGSGNRRHWLLIGLVTGIALENKWNVIFFIGSLGLGLLLSPQRRFLRSWWFVGGAAIAMALWLPDLIWQAQNGWPQLQIFHALQSDAAHNREVYIPAQIIYVGPVLTPIWLVGGWRLARSADAEPFRFLAWACGLPLLMIFILGGKPYYPGPAFAILFAASAVPLSRFLRAGGHLRPAAVVVVLVVAGAIEAPLAVPVLPAQTLAHVQLQKINYDLAETIGWRKQVAQIAAIYHSIPTDQRAKTVILTGNYGEAGAVDQYGPNYGLPQAYSGQNNFWLWGPPPGTSDWVIAVNVDPALLGRYFRRVTPAGIFNNGIGVSDDEQGVPIFLCSGQKGNWAGIWSAFRHYD